MDPPPVHPSVAARTRPSRRRARPRYPGSRRTSSVTLEPCGGPAGSARSPVRRRNRELGDSTRRYVFLGGLDLHEPGVVQVQSLDRSAGELDLDSVVIAMTAAYGVTFRQAELSTTLFHRGEENSANPVATSHGRRDRAQGLVPGPGCEVDHPGSRLRSSVDVSGSRVIDSDASRNTTAKARRRRRADGLPGRRSWAPPRGRLASAEEAGCGRAQRSFVSTGAALMTVANSVPNAVSRVGIFLASIHVCPSRA